MKKLLTFIISAVFIFSFKANAQEIEQLPDSLMKKRIIKMEFFSPLTGNLTLGYEHYLKNFMSLEFKVGIIGVGKQGFAERREVGMFFSGGPKFKLKPDYATKGTFGTHLLRGSYIRPEVSFGSFKYYRDSENFDFGDNATNVAFTINYGKQVILGDIMSLDWHIGIGYGYSSIDEADYYYRHVLSGRDFPLAWTAGFTLGVLLR